MVIVADWDFVVSVTDVAVIVTVLRSVDGGRV